MQKVRGIGGVFFKCNNPEKLAAWYKNNLGLELNQSMRASFNPQDIPTSKHNIWGVYENDTEYFAPTRQRFMFNFIVDDVTAMIAQVSEAGGRQVGEIESRADGDFAWFIDPEGFKVELWSPQSRAQAI